jgi:hypothetical protein
LVTGPHQRQGERVSAIHGPSFHRIGSGDTVGLQVVAVARVGYETMEKPFRTLGLLLVAVAALTRCSSSSQANRKNELPRETRGADAPTAKQKSDSKIQDPDIQTIASQFENDLIPWKASFAELRTFPTRTVNAVSEVEWLLDELVDYPRGMHRQAGSERLPGRILMRLESEDPSQPMQRPSSGGSGTHVFWTIATSNGELKKRVEEIMMTILR